MELSARKLTPQRSPCLQQSGTRRWRARSELIFEPFAGVVFHLSPAQSTRLGSLLHGGALAGMLLRGVGLVAHVAVSDMEQLKEVISEHFNRHACVTRAETAVVFNRVTQHEIPITEAELGLASQERAKPPIRNKGRQRAKR
jgi:hypothetical protein